MKIKIAILALASFLMVSSGPTVLAEKSFSGFSVTDIFVEDDKGTDSSSDDESVIADLIEDAKEPGVDSPLTALILKIINILTLLVGTFAFVMILIGGFIFATSGGDESRVDKGKSLLTQAIVGLVFAFLSYSIVVFVQSFLYS
ncbi:MAG: hypothetical protein ACI9QC_000585 [Oceanicoccus sp.]|jgi:hypothetical protein